MGVWWEVVGVGARNRCGGAREEIAVDFGGFAKCKRREVGQRWHGFWNIGLDV